MFKISLFIKNTRKRLRRVRCNTEQIVDHFSLVHVFEYSVHYLSVQLG